MKNVTIQVHIRGVKPLILHNGRTQNPLDPYVKKLKEYTRKRNKTDEDLEAMAPIEWEASLYWSDDIGLYMPSANIQAMLWEGAKKIKLGRDIIVAQVLDDAPIETANHKNLAKLREDKRTWFTRPVNVQNRRIVRTRFIAEQWEIKFRVQLDTEILNEQDFTQILGICGYRIGLGVWSPREAKPGTYGMFEVVDVSRV